MVIKDSSKKKKKKNKKNMDRPETSANRSVEKTDSDEAAASADANSGSDDNVNLLSHEYIYSIAKRMFRTVTRDDDTHLKVLMRGLNIPLPARNSLCLSLPDGQWAFERSVAQEYTETIDFSVPGRNQSIFIRDDARGFRSYKSPEAIASGVSIKLWRGVIRSRNQLYHAYTSLARVRLTSAALKKGSNLLPYFKENKTTGFSIIEIFNLSALRTLQKVIEVDSNDIVKDSLIQENASFRRFYAQFNVDKSWDSLPIDELLYGFLDFCHAVKKLKSAFRTREKRLNAVDESMLGQFRSFLKEVLQVIDVIMIVFTIYHSVGCLSDNDVLTLINDLKSKNREQFHSFELARVIERLAKYTISKSTIAYYISKLIVGYSDMLSDGNQKMMKEWAFATFQLINVGDSDQESKVYEEQQVSDGPRDFLINVNSILRPSETYLKEHRLDGEESASAACQSIDRNRLFAGPSETAAASAKVEASGPAEDCPLTP